MPTYEIAERIKQEAAEIAKKENSKEIVKELKRDGIDVNTIARYRGLTVEEINELRVRRKKE